MAYGAPRYAGFWIRLAAWIIDGFILAALVIGCLITIVGILAIPFVWILYHPLQWWKRGGTFGQRVVGVRVVMADTGLPIDGGTATVRYLVMFLEMLGTYILIGLLGFIWAAFDDRKQAWHDKAAGTVCIHVY